MEKIDWTFIQYITDKWLTIMSTKQMKMDIEDEVKVVIKVKEEDEETLVENVIISSIVGNMTI